MLDATKFYVDGSWIAPISDALRDVQNPSTEEVFAQITLGSAMDLSRFCAAPSSRLGRLPLEGDRTFPAEC